MIKAADDYQDALRVSVARAGNDHRLGAAEAPPAIISMFLGDELTEIIDAIESETPVGQKEKTLFKVGVHALPPFPKDTTDRNRTSPFAYTGAKFEFRMPGSAASISSCNIALNTAVAEELRQFADELEGAEDFNSALHALIRRVVHEHKRIIFNGNGYDPSWVEEAARRGLHNLRSTPEALPHFSDPENIELSPATRSSPRARYAPAGGLPGGSTASWSRLRARPPSAWPGARFSPPSAGQL